MLSGGERNRVHLAKVLRSGGNVLLLDEPTNDLDIDTLTALEDLLDGFPGTVLVVSHDRYFVDRVCDSVVALMGDGSLAALLGASPGASTAVKAMLDVLKRCFPTRMAAWEPDIRALVPSYGQAPMDDEALWRRLKARADTRLGV